jgi:hypothetical protein
LFVLLDVTVCDVGQRGVTLRGTTRSS